VGRSYHSAIRSLRSQRPSFSATVLPVAVLLLVSVGVQFWVVTTHRIPASSDQAVSALMAKHILEGRDNPVFYYGSTYAGTLEPHYLALVFLVLGSTVETYRIGLSILVVLMMLGVYEVTRRAFGRGAALVALAYLAIPPFFFLYKGLTSDGHYDAFNLFAVSAVLAALAIDRAMSGNDRRAFRFAVLGFVIGIGWWINPITPPISAAVVAWLFLRKRPRPGLKHAVAILAGVLVGSAPWSLWNLHNRWGSLASPELGAVTVRSALHNLWEIVCHSLPLLAGGARMRVAETWNTFPLSGIVVSVALLVLLLPPLARAVKGDRMARLFVMAFGALILTVIWSSRYVPSEPRVLFPYYVLVPPLIGAGIVSWATRPSRAAIAGACGVVLIAVHVSSLVGAHRHLRNTPGEVTASLDELLTALSRNGVRHLYTDYWTAYRISFESDEKIVAAPIPGEEAVRYPPYQSEVAGDPASAIVVGSPRDSCLESFLRERRLPHRRIAVAPWSLFLGLPPELLDFVREKNALPLPDDSFRVAWRLGAQPTSIRRGERAYGFVSFQNVSPCSWPQAVHLGYHWRAVAPGGPYIHDGGRELPNEAISPGETITLPVSLTAPAVPGEYDIEYDLVFEGVTWFADRGARPARVRIAIL
jgi:4-amino-4-deoxy-L-arabinose transferase-like glycosyltransferase